jgi:hypothetical protein
MRKKKGRKGRRREGGRGNKERKKEKKENNAHRGRGQQKRKTSARYCLCHVVGHVPLISL